MSFIANLVQQKDLLKPGTFLDGLSFPDLCTDEKFNALKYCAYSFIDNLDEDGAAEFARKLEKLLVEAKPSGAGEKPYASIVLFWMLRLKLFAFRALTLQEQVDLIKKYPVDIFANDLDLQAVLFKYIDLYENEKIIDEFCRNMISALLGSAERLGAPGPNQQSRVGDWIRAYQESVNRRGASINPGTFDIVSFIDTNSNVKYLQGNDKRVLRSLLSLYNWLLDPIVYLDDRPKAESKNSPFVTREKFSLPDLASPTPKAEAAVSPSPIAAPPKLPPSVPAPNGLLPRKNMEDVARAAQSSAQPVLPNSSAPKKQEAGTAPDRTQQALPATTKSGEPLSLSTSPSKPHHQDSTFLPMQGAGLSMGGANMQISDLAKAAQLKEQKVIDAKLEELKKRANKSKS